MRRILLAIIACLPLMSSHSVAQSTDIVYFRNGDRLTCKILEIKAGESIRVQTAQGSEMTIDYASIESVSPIKQASETQATETHQESLDEPYRRMTTRRGLTFGVGPQIDTNCDLTIMGVNFQVQYRPRSGRTLGIGVMPSAASYLVDDYYSYMFDTDFFAIPIYAFYKHDFLRTKASPFFCVKLGGMLIDSSWDNRTNNKTSAGVYSNLGVGCRVALRGPLALSPYIGVTLVDMDEFEDRYSCCEDGSTQTCFSIGLAVEF